MGVKYSNANHLHQPQRIHLLPQQRQYTRLEIRFKNQFCYIDAYTAPVLTDGWPPADWPEPAKNMPSVCAILLSIFAACVISAMMNGVLRSIRISVKNMNYPCMMMVNSQAYLNALF